MTSLPTAASVTRNPSQEQLREWALGCMPRVQVSEHGNVGYTTMVTARLAPSTYFVSDVDTGKPTMPRAEYERWAAEQDAFIADQDMVLIVGYIGPDPDLRTPVRLFIERKNSNIPAMQQQLYFPVEDPDAFDYRYTRNGRVTFPLADIRHRDPRTCRRRITCSS